MKNTFKKASIALLVASMAACSNSNGTQTSAPATEGTSGEANVYEAKATGYGGELNVKVTIEGETIKDIELGDNHETNVVMDRAFPVIKERILEANSPVVDSVSAATFSSYAVKQAVADAMKQAGLTVEGEVVREVPTYEGVEPTKIDDVTTDIVIVGGGPAGLGAAIAAKQENADANVMIIEKLDILSGNGKFDMNFFDMVNTKAQEAAGNPMTKEDFIEMKKEAAEGMARVEVWAEQEATIDAWLRDMGVELDYNYGGEGSTSHMAKEDQYAGEVIQAGLEAEANRLGVEIRTGTKGEDFVMDGNKVTGVVVTTNKNETYNIMANKTIVATGGFCSNKELLAEYAPGNEVMTTSNQMGTTGDFVKVFEEKGMKLERMDKMSVFSNIIDPRRDLTGGADLNLLVAADGTILNNNLSGLERYEMIENAGGAYYITDSTGYDSFYRIRKHVGLGYYSQGETIEELATALGIDGAALAENIATFNEQAKDGGEVEALDGASVKRTFDAEGPYYGVKVVPANHMTKGGVAANENAQVLFEDGSVVEGLYAAGEVTSQTGAYSASVCWGRVAGQQAAANLSK